MSIDLCRRISGSFGGSPCIGSYRSAEVDSMRGTVARPVPGLSGISTSPSGCIVCIRTRARPMARAADWQLLNRLGARCGRHRVARLRRVAGIVARRRQRFVRTVQARHQELTPIPNRLNQHFAVAAKNRVWGVDFTFVPTRAGWLYVAVVLDFYSRLMVGWAMSHRQRPTVGIETWLMAWQRRRPASGLIHHSDQGNQYRASFYQRMLERRGVIPRMSRKGNCYDNAPVQSFFSSLKNELTRHQCFQHRTPSPSISKCSIIASAYIRHSAIGVRRSLSGRKMVPKSRVCFFGTTSL